MISNLEFEVLLGRPESSVLDFKLSMYDFQDDQVLKNTAKLVKDVISFTNTVRNETSYILFGIEEKDDGSKELRGLEGPIDDAILQDKIKDKVFPRVIFSYYNFHFKGKLFGVLEFPIKKYSLPISPTIKMKGLEIGRIYYRNGSSNTEAIGQEVIRINNWFQSLSEVIKEEAVYNDISILLKRLTEGTQKLSSVFADGLHVSRKYKLIELNDFFSLELTGIKAEEVRKREDELSYRIGSIIISMIKAEISNSGIDSRTIKYQMDKSNDFFDYKLFYVFPISEIESYLTREDGIATLKMSSRNIFPETEKEYPVYGYIFNEMFVALYKNIRQKAIDKLMKI